MKNVTVVKRVLSGKAWFKRKRVRFISGYVTGEGIRLLNRIYCQTGEPVNFIILPNFRRTEDKRESPFLLFVVYTALVQSKGKNMFEKGNQVKRLSSRIRR